MNEPMINSANKETGDLCTAVLELATDNRLVDLRKNGDVLFDGRLCSSRDGGFSQLTTLPPDSILSRLGDINMELFSICVVSRGWIVNRRTGWKECKCSYAKSQGILFVCFKKGSRGWALKLSHAKELKFAMFKNSDSTVDHCLAKFKWRFGSLQIYLNKSQISYWQPVFVDAFNNTDLSASCLKPSEKAEIKSSLISLSRSFTSESSSTYSIKQTSSAQIPCHVVDSVDLMLGKDRPHTIEMPPTNIVDSIELLNTSTGQTASEHSNYKHSTSTCDTITGSLSGANAPCYVADNLDLILDAPRPKTIPLPATKIVDSEELLSQLRDCPEKRSPGPVNSPRTVAEKIEYYRKLSRRPKNEYSVKHSITKRNPHF